MLRFAYIAVEKFRKTPGELENILEKWLYLLRNLRRLDGRPEELRDRIFERFFKAAEIARMTPEQQQNYRDSIMNENDWMNAVNFAAEKAEKKGRKEGLAEGAKQANLNTAKKLHARGISAEDIADITGLAMEELAMIL